MRFRLIPRDEGFYPLFNEAAKNASDCAQLLEALLAGLPATGQVNDIVEIEKRGDKLMRQILNRLDTSIVTPFDREDIHALADRLDDVIDDLRDAAELTQLHQVTEALPEASELAGLLTKAAAVNVDLIAKLPKLRGLQGEIDEIDGIETQGDAVHRRALAGLYSGAHDAFTVLKWQDIIAAVEHALNSIERASDIVAAIAVKHA